MPWYRKLHWKIILAMIVGILFGTAASSNGWNDWTLRWISPWGEIFVNLLKLTAVPLILSSLITGVASIGNLQKLSRIGFKTLGVFFVTALISVLIGLFLANTIKPGDSLPLEVKEKLMSAYQGESDVKTTLADKAKTRGPLQIVVDMVPSNVFASAGDNRDLIKIVFFAILFGIALIQFKSANAKHLLSTLEGVNEAMVIIVEMIMKFAPYGVFALITTTIVTVSGSDSSVMQLIKSLGIYCLTVLLGLIIHTFLVYGLVVKFFSKIKVGKFYREIVPVQLFAFSSSSSNATLPLTMEFCNKNLKISDEVTSFVLPLGTTVNMDGTALYQSIAILFISQALGMHLDLTIQFMLIFSVILAAVGTPGIPGGSTVMTIVILESIGVPAAGIGLILGVDRILDMLRTVTNVTGDAVTAAVVDATEGMKRT